MVLMSRLGASSASRRSPAGAFRAGADPCEILLGGPLEPDLGHPRVRLVLGVELGQHVVEPLPVLVTGKALLRGLAPGYELRGVSEHVVIERFGVDRRQHRDRVPMSSDDDGLAALLQAVEHG